MLSHIRKKLSGTLMGTAEESYTTSQKYSERLTTLGIVAALVFGCVFTSYEAVEFDTQNAFKALAYKDLAFRKFAVHEMEKTNFTFIVDFGEGDILDIRKAFHGPGYSDDEVYRGTQFFDAFDKDLDIERKYFDIAVSLVSEVFPMTMMRGWMILHTDKLSKEYIMGQFTGNIMFHWTTAGLLLTIFSSTFGIVVMNVAAGTKGKAVIWLAEIYAFIMAWLCILGLAIGTLGGCFLILWTKTIPWEWSFLIGDGWWSTRAFISHGVWEWFYPVVGTSFVFGHLLQGYVWYKGLKKVSSDSEASGRDINMGDISSPPE